MAQVTGNPTYERRLTLTHPKPSLWIIELRNGPSNLLTVDFIKNDLTPALDAVEKQWREERKVAKATKDKERGKGALVIVGKRDQNKFFSNGLDFASITDDFFPGIFNPLLVRLLEFPIPTIAAINGHCFAGAVMLALACDYRVMTDGKAWLAMNEIHLGAPWPQSFIDLMRSKFGEHVLHREFALEGHRFSPAQALEARIVDYVVPGGTESVLAKAVELAGVKSSLTQAGAWGLMKKALYRDAVEKIKKDTGLKRASLNKL